MLTCDMNMGGETDLGSLNLGRTEEAHCISFDVLTLVSWVPPAAEEGCRAQPPTVEAEPRPALESHWAGKRKKSKQPEEDGALPSGGSRDQILFIVVVTTSSSAATTVVARKRGYEQHNSGSRLCIRDLLLFCRQHFARRVGRTSIG